MSKKKKKQPRNKAFETVDAYIDIEYENAIREIEDMQLRLQMADKRAKKRIKKKMKKKDGYAVAYNKDPYRIKERREIIKEMEGNSFLDRVMNFLNDIIPIVSVIARLVASLIVSILSIGEVQTHISPGTLVKLKGVYDTAVSFAA